VVQKCTAVCGPRSYFRPAAHSLTSRKGAGVTLPIDSLPCLFIHDARHRMSQWENLVHVDRNSFAVQLTTFVITETTRRRVVK